MRDCCCEAAGAESTVTGTDTPNLGILNCIPELDLTIYGKHMLCECGSIVAQHKARILGGQRRTIQSPYQPIGQSPK